MIQTQTQVLESPDEPIATVDLETQKTQVLETQELEDAQIQKV